MSVECYYCAFVCVFVCYVYAVAQSLRHQHEMYIYFMYWLHENREILCKWFIIFREDERNVCSAVVCTTIAFVLFFPSFVYSSPVECGTRTVDARCGATDGESNFPVECQQHDARTVTYNVYIVQSNGATAVGCAKQWTTHSLSSIQFSHVNGGTICTIFHAHTGTVTRCW